MSRRQWSTRTITAVALLGAVTAILGLTPLGFVPIGPARATLLHIPTIIGGILYGPGVGGLVGFVFGLFSWLQNTVQPTPISFVFLNPLISVFPRILIGVVAGWVYRIVRNKQLKVYAAAIAGTLINTVLVLGLIYLLYGYRFVEGLGKSGAHIGGAILSIGLINGLPELILAALVTSAVVRAVRRR